MKPILETIGYTDKLKAKDKFAYIIAGIGIMQLLMFLYLYIRITDSSLLVLQTVSILFVYASSVVFFKQRRFIIGKVILTMVMSLQVILLSTIWFPERVLFILYFFIVPPISFIIFDLENFKEKQSLIWVNAVTIVLIILAGLIQPLEVVQLNTTYTTILRMMTIVMTFLVEVLVFYFYAHNLLITNKELRLLANTDMLTNVANRRVLFSQGEQLYEICNKYDKAFMLMIIDIDFFKNINDKYGHPAGDKILREMTQLISSNIRKEDLLCRYGGEEFAILFKNIREDQIKIIKNIREKIIQHDFYVDHENYVNISFSAGVITCQETFNGFDEAVLIADRLLYEAKTSGRNRIIFDNGYTISDS